MVEAQSTHLADMGGEAIHVGRTERGERMPIPQAAAIMVTLSLGMWAMIGLGVSWLLG